MSLQQHPLSAAFPAMSAEDFQALTDSIQAIGVQNPVTLLDGMVLDGWHRYRATNDLAMDCPSTELADWIDPLDFVRAQNKTRRHLTSSAWALIEVSLRQWNPPHRPNKGAGPAPLSVSNADMAEASGTSIRLIQHAKTVASKAIPEVAEAVMRGDLGGEKAAAIAKMPKEEQAAAIDKPLPRKPAPAALTAASEPEQQPEAPPEYTELDALRDQISELQAELVVARMGDVSEEEKQHAAQLIAELQAEIKTLQVTVKAANLSRDFLMEENAQMKKQMQMQRREIDKLKAGK